MAYGRLDRDTYEKVKKFGKQHDREIRETYGMKKDVRMPFDTILRFMLSRLTILGQWQDE